MNKRASKISQKIITSDKYYPDLEKYDSEFPKKVLDKIAKYELSPGDFQYYKNNFNKIKPYLEDDLRAYIE